MLLSESLHHSSAFCVLPRNAVLLFKASSRLLQRPVLPLLSLAVPPPPLLSMMSSDSGHSTDDELTIALPATSKREYLLAQIRQKDAIIESLLKQVRERSPFGLVA